MKNIALKYVYIRGNRTNQMVLDIIDLKSINLNVFVELNKNIPNNYVELTSIEDGEYYFSYPFFSENKITPNRVFYIDEIGNEIDVEPKSIVGSNCSDKLRKCFNKKDNFGSLSRKSIKIIRDDKIYFSNGSMTPLKSQFWGNKYNYKHYILNEM